MGYTVNGVLYQMPECDSVEERKEMAKQFVQGLKIGEEMTLQAEPDNPKDENAIAVYYKWERIGYISMEENRDVLKFLDDRGTGIAKIEKLGEKRHFYVSIDGAPDRIYNVSANKGMRKLPESPLPKDMRMEISREESKTEFLVPKILCTVPSKDNAPTLLAMLEQYMPLTGLTLCPCDIRWMRDVAVFMEGLLAEKVSLGLNSKYVKQLETWCHDLHDTISDATSANGRPGILNKHISTINELAHKPNEMLARFDSMAGRDLDKMKQWQDKLQQWLDSLDTTAFTNGIDEKGLINLIVYGTNNRREVYDIISILLLRKHIEDRLRSSDPEFESKVEKLKKFFTGDDASMAADYLQFVMDHQDNQVEIPRRAKVLSDQGIIKHGMASKPLWNVIAGDFELYDSSRQAWNNQTK